MMQLLTTKSIFWKNLNKIVSFNYKNLVMLNDFGSKTNGGVQCTINNKYQWKPEHILSEPFKIGGGHACLVLNREIRIPQNVAKELWQNAIVRCCVDGGTNRWRKFLKLSKCTLKPPDLITGDFDSITDETKQCFNTSATQHIHTPDQNDTDFNKAVLVLKPILLEKHLQDIIVYQDTSGRFDQIMANINTLFKHEQDFLNIYLLSGNSVTWLLKPGQHSITIPSELVEKQRWCSLIPVGQKATNVTTKGLKWNLSNSCLSFGGLVSTSNTYALCSVEIETDTPLIWSMGIFSFKDD